MCAAITSLYTSELFSRADYGKPLCLGSASKDCVLEVDGVLVSVINASHVMSSSTPWKMSAQLASTTDPLVSNCILSLAEAKILSQLGLKTSREDLTHLAATLSQLGTYEDLSTGVRDFAALLLLARQEGIHFDQYSEQLLLDLGADRGNADDFLKELGPYLDLVR